MIQVWVRSHLSVRVESPNSSWTCDSGTQGIITLTESVQWSLSQRTKPKYWLETNTSTCDIEFDFWWNDVESSSNTCRSLCWRRCVATVDKETLHNRETKWRWWIRPFCASVRDKKLFLRRHQQKRVVTLRHLKRYNQTFTCFFLFLVGFKRVRQGFDNWWRSFIILLFPCVYFTWPPLL